ncbi:hypothetical protein IWQ60_009427 [Tieghemiomyces parasiticus]|uniref:Myb-like domain-containing protein n=1 Tax=Tieghemiomyces parasiticus TaxID=78921 RepID=A0A9W7ZN33_9FUNG|nr:hypothetical protein IWQ60_009427 [Tieghemiomyces parasiticus]
MLADTPSANPSTMAASNDPTELFRTKQEWVRQMRLQFCVRPEFEVTRNIIHPDGTLNQDYFRPPKDAPRPDADGHGGGARKWTDRERSLLIQGISTHGIGHFRAISEELLPGWSPNDLRIKTIRLIGRQNMQLYKDWKGDEAAILRENARNREIAQRFDMWKNGCLVYDDDGQVLQAILASEPSAATAAVAEDNIEID